jgi:hypothetical protein
MNCGKLGLQISHHAFSSQNASWYSSHFPSTSDAMCEYLRSRVLHEHNQFIDTLAALL